METEFTAWAIDTRTDYGYVKQSDFGDKIPLTMQGCPILLMQTRATARRFNNLLKKRIVGRCSNGKVVKVKVTIDVSED
jgi:hypothetical protein